MAAATAAATAAAAAPATTGGALPAATSFTLRCSFVHGRVSQNKSSAEVDSDASNTTAENCVGDHSRENSAEVATEKQSEGAEVKTKDCFRAGDEDESFYDESQLLSSDGKGVLEFIPDGLVTVQEGTIIRFLRGLDEIQAAIDAGDVDPSAENYFYRPELICVPGFIDLHVHAPQSQFNGTATDLSLMDWLQRYTFPAERRLESTKIAAVVYDRLVRRLLSHGTTTAVYYATIHVNSTKVLVDTCVRRGQRAVVGKVCMDQHGAEGYVETTEEAIAGTEELIRYVHDEGHSGDGLVAACITPRFLPTCTTELLRGLGELAKKYDDRGIYCQTHMSESNDQLAFCAALFPDEPRDLPHFDRVGLITHRCVLAHGVHLRDEELDLIRARGAAVAPCPLSNFSLADGHFDIPRAAARGVKVGLGTDVAGGYSPSMLVTCRTAVLASRALSITRSGCSFPATSDQEVNWRRAFWYGTVGGARSLGLEKVVGSFGVGMQFDALLLDCENDEVFDDYPEAYGEERDPTAGPKRRDEHHLVDSIERWFNLGDDRNILRVYVRGRSVKQ